MKKDGVKPINNLSVCKKSTFIEFTTVFDYRTRANKGRRHYSKIMFWTLKLSHENDKKNIF